MKDIINKSLFIFGIFFFWATTACSSPHTIKKMNLAQNVDLKRFMGKWYEIARYPHRFEKNLAGVSATYTLLESGKIEVLNKGFVNNLNGKEKSIVGKAKPGASGESGHLQVSFFWLFYADYLILELDPDYQYAIIGSSSPNYFWILSRTPQLDERTLNGLFEKAKVRGYDLTKIQMVEQAK